MLYEVITEARKAAQARLDSIRGFIMDGTLSFEEAALRFSDDKDRITSYNVCYTKLLRGSCSHFY